MSPSAIPVPRVLRFNARLETLSWELIPVDDRESDDVFDAITLDVAAGKDPVTVLARKEIQVPEIQVPWPCLSYWIDVMLPLASFGWPHERILFVTKGW